MATEAVNEAAVELSALPVQVVPAIAHHAGAERRTVADSFAEAVAVTLVPFAPDRGTRDREHVTGFGTTVRADEFECPK